MCEPIRSQVRFRHDSLCFVTRLRLPHIPLDDLITRSIPNTVLPPPAPNHPLDMRYRLRNRSFSVSLERETGYYIDECNNQQFDSVSEWDIDNVENQGDGVGWGKEDVS